MAPIITLGRLLPTLLPTLLAVLLAASAGGCTAGPPAGPSPPRLRLEASITQYRFDEGTRNLKAGVSNDGTGDIRVTRATILWAPLAFPVVRLPEETIRPGQTAAFVMRWRLLSVAIMRPCAAGALYHDRTRCPTAAASAARAVPGLTPVSASVPLSP